MFTDFAATITQQGHRQVLALEGVLDARSLVNVNRRLSQAPQLVIDLTEVTATDRASIRVLEQIALDSIDAGGIAALVAPRKTLRLMLGTYRLAPGIAVIETRPHESHPIPHAS